MTVIEEIVFNKARQVARGHTVLIVVPDNLYEAFENEMKPYLPTRGEFELARLRLSGQSGPHFSICTVINPHEAEERVVKEFRMVPAKLNGRHPMFETIEI